jgi:hypothetical protein
MDEVAPGRFVVQHPQLRGLLKGEGTFQGRLFTLTSWRREGLIARMRQRGFRVRTLEDALAELPTPPPPPRPGPAAWRPLAAHERFSRFDTETFTWVPLEVKARDGVPGVLLRAGWVLRRRKGRGGPSSYYLAVSAGEGVGLHGLGETDALLAGYAAALAVDDRPLVVEQRGDRLLLPDVELPPPHRALLERIAADGPDGPTVDQHGWPLARALFERLGVGLVIR